MPTERTMATMIFIALFSLMGLLRAFDSEHRHLTTGGDDHSPFLLVEA